MERREVIRGRTWLLAGAGSALFHIAFIGALLTERRPVPEPLPPVMLVELLPPPEPSITPPLVPAVPAAASATAPGLVRTATVSPEASPLAVTNAAGAPDALGSGAGAGSSWRVAPSRVYRPERSDERLDCSLSNDSRIWKSRQEHCNDEALSATG